MRNAYLFLLVLSGLLLTRHPAAAQSCLNDFTLVGSAISADTGCYRITQQGVLNSQGGMWGNVKIDLNYPFDFTFDVNQCGSADGLVFVLQNSGVTANTVNGGSLGYYQDPTGLFAQSVGVELDLYTNSGFPQNDPPSPHMMLALNGNFAGISPRVVIPGLGNCATSVHRLHIKWTPRFNNLPVGFLEVELDGVLRMAELRDLVGTVFGGNPSVWFGFTGSTGAETADQFVCPVSLTAGPPPPALQAGPTSICPGGTVALSIPGQAVGTTYQWSPAEGLSATNVATVAATPDTTTLYQVIVTVPSGCQYTDTVRVTVLAPPTVTLTPRQEICPGASTTLTAASAAVGATYAWTPRTGLSATTGATVTATPTATTLYTVTTTSLSGCPRLDTVRVVVLPPVTIAVPTPAELPYGGSTILTATGAGAGGTYQWSPAAGLSPATGATVTVQPDTTTTYTIVGTDVKGCIGQATVVVAVAPKPVFLPNIITPNGDELNQTFQPYVSREPVKLQVFNRWGRLVFEQDNYANTWAAEGQTDGLYYYRLSTAAGQSWKGWLEVVR